MSTWKLILYTVVVSLIVIAVWEFVSRWRSYSKAVAASLGRYGQLAKSCPNEQLVLVFQEITDLMEQAAMTESQMMQARCLLSYLMGRMDQAGIKDVVIV